MVTIRSFKVPARRSLVASVLVGTALLVAAVPANARGGKSARTAATAAATVSANSITLVPSVWYPDQPCTFDVEYHWNDVKGKDLSASVQLVDGSGTPLASAPIVAPVSGSGWAMFFFKFYGSVGEPREIYARGSVLSGGVEDSTTVVTSGSLSSACGGAFGVVAPTVIPLY